MTNAQYESEGESISARQRSKALRKRDTRAQRTSRRDNCKNDNMRKAELGALTVHNLSRLEKEDAMRDTALATGIKSWIRPECEATFLQGP